MSRKIRSSRAAKAVLDVAATARGLLWCESTTRDGVDSMEPAYRMRSMRITPKRTTVRITEAKLARFLLLLACASRTFAQSNGPLDSLREQFVAKARERSAFQPIAANLAGRVVSVDDSRRILYQSLLQRQAAAFSVLGKYVESVTIDDGQSRAKAVCSVFERGSQLPVTPGELISVSGTFIGAILPGAVELIKCSFTGGQPPRMDAAPAAPGGPGASSGPAQPYRNQAQMRAAERCAP